MTEQIKSAKDLRVYKRAYALAMEIFQVSKGWPAEERHSLTDADGENGETDTWLDYALDCKYLPAPDHERLTEENRAVGSMLGAMLNNPQPFLTKH